MNSYSVFFLNPALMPANEPYSLDRYVKVATIDKGEWMCYFPDNVFITLQNRVEKDEGGNNVTIPWCFQKRRGMMVGDLIRDDDSGRFFYCLPKGELIEYANAEAFSRKERS